MQSINHPSPEVELCQLLAESHNHLKGILGVRRRMVSQIPAQQDAIQAEITMLRQKILAEGVGQSEDLENRYLRLLHDLRVSEQVRIMPSGQAENPLTKGLMEYGKALLEAYGEGILVKAGKGDLQACVLRLESAGDPDCTELAAKIRGACGIHR